MSTSQSLQDIQDYIEKNEIKIAYLQELNESLKDRFDVKSSLKSLHAKFLNMQKDEREQTEKYNQSRKFYLSELEHKGAELCQEHSRILHQIEHIEWHIGHGHGAGHDHGAKHDHHCATQISCKSSATSLNRSAAAHKSYDALSLENTSERLIKTIADLRRKIFVAKEKLEKEIQRKKCVEKNLSEMRKDISRQKKMISNRRITPLPALTSVRKSAFVQ